MYRESQGARSFADEYAQAVFDAPRQCAASPANTTEVVAGTCGEFSFVRTEFTTGGTTGYPMRHVTFYENGKTVGVERGADVQGDACLVSAHYGHVPACKPREERVLCSNPSVTRSIPFEWRIEQKAGRTSSLYVGTRDYFADQPRLPKVLASFAGCPRGDGPTAASGTPEPSVSTFACGDRRVVHVGYNSGDASSDSFIFFDASGVPVAQVAGTTSHPRLGTAPDESTQARLRDADQNVRPWDRMTTTVRIGSTPDCAPVQARQVCQGSSPPPSSRPGAS